VYIRVGYKLETLAIPRNGAKILFVFLEGVDGEFPST
jgi:hypothetical protein